MVVVAVVVPGGAVRLCCLGILDLKIMDTDN